MKPFRSFPSTVQLLNQPEQPPSAEQMAADLAEETCLRLKELKAAALEAEQNADEPLVESAEQIECYKTLDALMQGRHKWIVVPVVLEHFPELIRPPTEMEKRAVEQYLANKKAVEA